MRNTDSTGSESPEETSGNPLGKIGATGKFPEGKDYHDDEGELRFAIGHDQDNVRIEFGKPVAWLALPPKLARQLAALLINHANQIRE